jgi:hypothetical protein
MFMPRHFGQLDKRYTDKKVIQKMTEYLENYDGIIEESTFFLETGISGNLLRNHAKKSPEIAHLKEVLQAMTRKQVITETINGKIPTRLSTLWLMQLGWKTQADVTSGGETITPPPAMLQVEIVKSEIKKIGDE